MLPLLATMSFASYADWSLVPQESDLTFTTFKKEHIAENHYFERFNAKVSSAGDVKLVIDLASVNTNIPIRDERMKEHLFEVNRFSSATFNAKIAPSVFDELKVGASQNVALSGTLDLHGQKQSLTTDVKVTRLIDGKFVVTAISPILIKAQDYALLNGVKKLQELAGLPGISTTVPVYFSFTFQK